MRKQFAIASFILSVATTLWATGLTATPDTFDFGWCPPDAKVSAEFVVKNVSQSPIELQALRPSCGCTAAQFTPETLASDNETKIGLTFNTRGYDGVRFNKPATLKTGTEESGIQVHVTGYVLDPNAQVVPMGTGMARYKKGDKSKQFIGITNKSSEDVTLSIIQKPADWVELDMESLKISAGQTASLQVSIKGSVEDKRDASVTFEAKGASLSQRLTVGFQTGYEPPIQAAPPASPAGAPATSPKTPAAPTKGKK